MDLFFENNLTIPELDKTLRYTILPHPVIREVLVFETPDETALALALRQRQAARENPGKQSLWPTGLTQLDVYKWHRELVKITGDNPLRQTLGRHLDEYYPCAATERHSFVKYLHVELADPLGIPFEYMNGAATDPVAEAVRYDTIIRSHPICMTSMGTDEKDGHIAFIRPGTPFSQTPVHFVTLSDGVTTRDRMERGEQTPDGALTQGFGMLDAENIFEIGYGKKGLTFRRALFDGKPDSSIPLSVLGLPQYGRKTTLFLDREAAEYLV